MKTTVLRFGTPAAAATLLLAAALTTSGSAVAADGTRTSGGVSGTSVNNNGSSSDPYANLPASMTLTGVIRDFREKSASGGHPDFEQQPSRGFGHYAYIVADQLDADGKPAFASKGRKVTAQYTDRAGRNIMPPRNHIEQRADDKKGTLETQEGGAANGAARFAQWFRDVNGVNLSMPLPITLVRSPGTNIYTFSDRTDPTYANRSGFFPINGQLMGNSGGSTPNQNFHFTYELDTSFVYRRGSGQVFSFTGDDDVWVFIDGKCVIDIGGVHGAVSQSIELDRCTWLQDGQRYSLKFFFAERHRTQSNFRIDTTINLQNAELPATSALYD